MRDDSDSSSDDVFRLEIRRIYLSAFKARLVAIPVSGAVFVAFCLWDPVPWKLVYVGALLASAWTLFIVEYLRHRASPPTVVRTQVNFALTLFVFSFLVYITGGIESPLLPIYALTGVAFSFLFGAAERALPPISIGIAAILFFAAGASFGWLPRATPAFFHLDAEGFWNHPVYVWIKAGTLIIFISAGLRFGLGAHRALEARTREAMAARRQAMATLAAQNRELLSVSMTIAHELKNPLASIQGLTQLMVKNDTLTGKDRERLEVMRREIGRMATTLEELRNFTRPMSELSLKRVDLTRLVDDLCVLSEGLAQARGTELVRVATPPVEIVCDPLKVKQAILNLLQNSLEATTRGDRIEVTVDRGPDHARAVVRDSGPGIPDELAARLFLPGSTTKEHGSGIGLVVARAIAEQHGGSLSLGNVAGGGCAATLSLPLSGIPTGPDLETQQDR